MPGILNISEASAIGVHAMMLIAGRPERPNTVPELASELQVSAAHLQKVLQRLVHAGLACSTRGPKGGYGLAKDAASIKLGEIFAAIEGTLPMGLCLLDKDRCCMGTCALGDMMHSINDAVASRLQTRLSELVRNTGRRADGPAPAGPRFEKSRGKTRHI
ncbi:MAG: Rrf2 family transcriptional regulator [Elusimicrobia bacterium]|nr:Rrf2 family transcriptional regulator [Elusimicrobiota bacterium]